MNNASTTKASTPKKIEDLGVKDGAQVIAGRSNPNESLSLNFTKIESAYTL
jgi:hypothetical protein